MDGVNPLFPKDLLTHDRDSSGLNYLRQFKSNVRVHVVMFGVFWIGRIQVESGTF